MSADVASVVDDPTRLSDDGTHLYCTICRAVQPFALPMPVRVFTLLITTFADHHTRTCGPAAFGAHMARRATWLLRRQRRRERWRRLAQARAVRLTHGR